MPITDDSRKAVYRTIVDGHVRRAALELTEAFRLLRIYDPYTKASEISDQFNRMLDEIK